MVAEIFSPNNNSELDQLDQDADDDDLLVVVVVDCC